MRKSTLLIIYVKGCWRTSPEFSPKMHFLGKTIFHMELAHAQNLKNFIIPKSCSKVEKYTFKKNSYFSHLLIITSAHNHLLQNNVRFFFAKKLEKKSKTSKSAKNKQFCSPESPESPERDVNSDILCLSECYILSIAAIFR